MAEREDEQDVPTSQNDPSRSKQYACVVDSNKAGRAAHRTPDRILERFGGAENPGQLAGVHRSESAGAALLTEQATYQQASDSAAVLDDSYHDTKCEVAILRADEAELFRCGTPVGVQAHDGLLSSLLQGYSVPFPDSSTIGISSRRLKLPVQAAESSHSDASNANPGDFGGTDTPPWSPRRVPPAHLWGEGPPRYPGYRSGGALLPGAPEGVSAVHMMDAACELQALLKHRTSLGLGPLLHAQPYFSAESQPEHKSPGLECTSSLVPPTPVLQAPPMQGLPFPCALHAVTALPPGALCAEGALLSPVPMQLPAGGSFPTPCMWGSTQVHIREALLAPGAGSAADEVSSAHNAFDWFGNSTGGPAVVPHTTADIMGISSALQCKNVLQPKQAEGIKRSSDTPALTERDQTAGSKRSAEGVPADGQPPGAARKPRRATKRRLF